MVVYGPFCEETQSDINAEVENFFSAFIQTCNHDKWPDGEQRWPKGADSSLANAMAYKRC